MCIPWEEPKLRRVHGRGFKNNDLKRGYMSESMDDFPRENRAARERRWRKEMEERYGEDG